MLLEDLNPLHHSFEVDNLRFKADEFDDLTISFTVTDVGGLRLGDFEVAFDEEGENLSFTDGDKPILSRLQKHHDGNKIMRNIKRTVRSTL